MSSNQIGSKDLTFSFEHSEISEAIAKHQSRLSEFQQKLDSVSADIKALEGYLLANNIAISAKVDVFYHTEVNGKRFEKTAGRFELVEVAMDLPMFKSRRKENKADELKAVVFAESLLWDRDASGKFRLFYQKSQAPSSIEIGKDLSNDDQGSYFFKYRKFTQNINLSSPQAGRFDFQALEPFESIEKKPLIETGIETRVNFRRFLPELIETLSEFVEKI